MIKLKQLLNENAKVQAYSDELGKYIMLMKPRIAGLKFDVEYMTGSWYWENSKFEDIIYATWGWEGKKEVPIEIGLAPDGHEGEMVKKLKYNPKFDLKKDAQWYISNMKRYLPGIYRDYV